MKTKWLTRLSVYVERKNVCKWSLAYLHVGKLLLAFFFTQFVSNIVESVLFYSGMVTREVVSEKRDFQDGATGRNSIAFRTVLCMWRKRPEKEGGIKGFTLFPPVPPCPKPALGERKGNSNIFFHYSVSRNVLFPVNFIKWLNNDVIIIEKSCFGELSLVPTRAHSCVLLDTIESNIFTSKLRSWQLFLKPLGLIRLTRTILYTSQARKQQIPKLSPVQTAWQYSSQKGPDLMSRAGLSGWLALPRWL